MNIGSEANAITASSFMGADTPQGWHYIGSGAYRRSYLGPDGYVYKVQCNSDSWDDPYDCNRREGSLYADVAHTTVDFRLAACTFYECGVIAMEYVDGPPAHRFPGYYSDGISKAVDDWCRSVELWDVCGDNIRTNSKGEVVIVDYAT